MADFRVTGALPPALQPARQGDAARAAQRAFFQAALNNTAPVVAPHPVAAQPTPSPPAPRVTAAQATAAGEPNRFMRPGSLLDIRV